MKRFRMNAFAKYFGKDLVLQGDEIELESVQLFTFKKKLDNQIEKIKQAIRDTSDTDPDVKGCKAKLREYEAKLTEIVAEYNRMPKVCNLQQKVRKAELIRMQEETTKKHGLIYNALQEAKAANETLKKDLQELTSLSVQINQRLTNPTFLPTERIYITPQVRCR